MKHTKRTTVVASLLLIVLLLSAVFAVAFNYSMNRYINSEARRTLRADMEYYSGGESLVSDYYEEASIFASTIIDVNSDFAVKRDNYTRQMDYERDNILLRKCKLNKEYLENGGILVFPIMEENYYAAMIPPDGGNQNEIGILYINTAPIGRLVKKINAIYAVIILISSVAVSLAGLRAGKILDDSDRKMKQFFQNVSHELKTPIMTIQGYAEGIEQNIVPDKEKAAKVILSESDKMAVLVNEILELSKFESGLRKAVFHMTDISELLYETLERLQPVAEKKNLRFEVSVQDSALVYCDSELMERVFLNLLTNAMRYADKTITITSCTEKNHLKICISDDGAALSEKDAVHIFERFYRGEKGSSGVGLALAKEIIDIHKGRIFVQTHIGTCFVVELRKSI